MVPEPSAALFRAADILTLVTTCHGRLTSSMAAGRTADQARNLTSAQIRRIILEPGATRPTPGLGLGSLARYRLLAQQRRMGKITLATTLQLTFKLTAAGIGM